MVKFLRNGWIALFIIAALLPFQSALADVGPKPTMDFSFVQGVSGQTLTITSGTLYECDQSDCSDAKPLQELGPQRFTCQADHCSALSYGFSTYHRLELQFSDGVTRQSNIFKSPQFDSVYEVTIQPTDLIVRSKVSLSPVNFFNVYTILLVCGLCLIGVIVLVVVIVLLVRRNRKK